MIYEASAKVMQDAFVGIPLFGWASGNYFLEVIILICTQLLAQNY